MQKIDFTDEGSIAAAQDNLMGEQTISTTVSDCPQCGGEHIDLVFERLKNPVSDGSQTFTHTSLCPDTQIQLRLTFGSPTVIAARERAKLLAQAGETLHIDDMSHNDVQRVLEALRDKGTITQ